MTRFYSTANRQRVAAPQQLGDLVAGHSAADESARYFSALTDCEFAEFSEPGQSFYRRQRRDLLDGPLRQCGLRWRRVT
jgi:hypothetical protein